MEQIKTILATQVNTILESDAFKNAANNWNNGIWGKRKVSLAYNEVLQTKNLASIMLLQGKAAIAKHVEFKATQDKLEEWAKNENDNTPQTVSDDELAEVIKRRLDIDSETYRYHQDDFRCGYFTLKAVGYDVDVTDSDVRSLNKALKANDQNAAVAAMTAIAAKDPALAQSLLANLMKAQQPPAAPAPTQ